MKSLTLRHDDYPIDSETLEAGAAGANSHQLLADANSKSRRKNRAQHNRSHLVAPFSLLNVGEVAERIGVSEKTVRRWIDAKVLPVHRIGRLVRISETDLIAFIRMSRDA
jgi:excisionase family DNA binding protein